MHELTLVKKSGDELFSFHGENLQMSVLTFWQWSNSDLLGNALRGKIAEYIVGSALDCTSSHRVEWDEYDLITADGLKIEVKSSAYLQSWHQEKLLKISFNIPPTGVSQTTDVARSRKADVYVFCVLTHKDKLTVNPLNLEQWDFYVLPCAVLNERVPNQKSITLSSLLDLSPVCVNFEQLAEAILSIK